MRTIKFVILQLFISFLITDVFVTNSTITLLLLFLPNFVLRVLVVFVFHLTMFKIAQIIVMKEIDDIKKHIEFSSTSLFITLLIFVTVIIFFDKLAIKDIVVYSNILFLPWVIIMLIPIKERVVYNAKYRVCQFLIALASITLAVFVFFISQQIDLLHLILPTLKSRNNLYGILSFLFYFLLVHMAVVFPSTMIYPSILLSVGQKRTVLDIFSGLLFMIISILIFLITRG